MREIKFRAWDEKRKLFEYWGIGDIDGDGAGCKFPSLNQTKLPQMQYTGLKDKNGKEIYEGDIAVGISRDPQKHYIGKIHFDSIYGSWVVTGYDREFPHMKFPLSIPLGECRFDIEVIGNIYKNPESLEQQ